MICRNDFLMLSCMHAGYVVLERPNPALVAAVSARVYTVISDLDAGEVHTRIVVFLLLRCHRFCQMFALVTRQSFDTPHSVLALLFCK